MAGPTGFPQSIQGLNPQIRRALFLVDGVQRSMASLLPRAQATGSVFVSEQQLRYWEGGLQRALQLVEQVPVILIYPPPPSARFLEEAARQLQRALAALSGIRGGFAARHRITRNQLLFILNSLRRASSALVQALYAR